MLDGIYIPLNSLECIEQLIQEHYELVGLIEKKVMMNMLGKEIWKITARMETILETMNLTRTSWKWIRRWSRC